MRRPSPRGRGGVGRALASRLPAAYDGGPCSRAVVESLAQPLTHVVAGMFFLGQAAVLGTGMLLGLEASPARLTAYVIALLVGWAGG